MVLMSSISPNHQELLLNLAFQSIEYGLQHNHEMPVDEAHYPEPLQAVRSAFVTLLRQRQLRGCIGSLTPSRPLVIEVAHNAYASAFHDFRFVNISSAELPLLTIEISVLSPQQPMQFISEDDLLRQLRPMIDGLTIEDNGRRATFLPQVWQQLPDRQTFLQHLKEKAGLPFDYWSDTLKAYHYTVEHFAAPPQGSVKAT
ncbi:AmmeMemoRadiSam system protein A [Zooshikella ganghwensis]|uniref:AmmeMemoRadiSam system protein A n=2 Tax=Zooshikella ganghwensis TaxID=202772 RepID=A0A4P9VS09_9GAMM|nr:AmmeMemoRadiSam system protein A [Zooshikella ganghwensis]